MLDWRAGSARFPREGVDEYLENAARARVLILIRAAAHHDVRDRELVGERLEPQREELDACPAPHEVDDTVLLDDEPVILHLAGLNAEPERFSLDRREPALELEPLGILERLKLDVPIGPRHLHGGNVNGEKRRGPDSNRCTRLCRPLPNLSATAPARLPS